MDSAPRFRLIVLLAMGLFGAAAGHAAGYWLAHPQHADRHAVLEVTGHGYMEMGIAVGLVAGLVALIGQFGLSCLEANRADRPAMTRSRAWLVLALVQTAAFVSVELAERALAGLAVDVLSEPAFWLGLPLQILVAGLGSLLLSLVRRVARALVASQPAVRPPYVADFGSANDHVQPASPFGYSFASRAPPPLPA